MTTSIRNRRGLWAAAVVIALHAAVSPAAAGFLKATPVLDVQAPVLLAAIEKNGFGLDALLGAAPGTLRDLYQASPPAVTAPRAPVARPTAPRGHA